MGSKVEINYSKIFYGFQIATKMSPWFVIILRFSSEDNRDNMQLQAMLTVMGLKRTFIRVYLISLTEQSLTHLANILVRFNPSGVSVRRFGGNLIICAVIGLWASNVVELVGLFSCPSKATAEPRKRTFDPCGYSFCTVINAMTD